MNLGLAGKTTVTIMMMLGEQVMYTHHSWFNCV